MKTTQILDRTQDLCIKTVVATLSQLCEMCYRSCLCGRDSGSYSDFAQKIVTNCPRGNRDIVTAVRYRSSFRITRPSHSVICSSCVMCVLFSVIESVLQKLPRGALI
jgi:hypothetical protein